jgi:NADH:ubiquinone oxidoreductase subunit H
MQSPPVITAQFVVSVVVILVVIHVVLITVAYSIYLERKISARGPRPRAAAGRRAEVPAQGGLRPEPGG